MTADNALAAKAAAGGAANKPPRSNRKLTSKISPTDSELPDIQNRTLTNSFNSARRKDTLSELDLSSVKHADGDGLRKTTKRSSVPKGAKL